MRDVALTTVDNPFNPLDDTYNWWAYDTQHCYDDQGNLYRSDCCSIVARLCEHRGIPNDAMTDTEFGAELEDAIDEFILYDPTCIFRKFVQETND